jgi:hypothetical protein
MIIGKYPYIGFSKKKLIENINKTTELSFLRDVNGKQEEISKES